MNFTVFIANNDNSWKGLANKFEFNVVFANGCYFIDAFLKKKRISGTKLNSWDKVVKECNSFSGEF